MLMRSCGVLLHVSSLPSPGGVGDLGPAAYQWVDCLARAGQGLWQILPLTPTHPGRGNSPYNSESAFAGNPLFISPQLLVEEGLLAQHELGAPPDAPPEQIDYEAAWSYRLPLLSRAFARFRWRLQPGYGRFAQSQAYWLEDYALFKALSLAHNEAPWTWWPHELKHRHPDALAQATKEHQEEISRQKFYQFLFFRQWARLRAHCRSKGVQIMGDVPIYVDLNSADCWAHPHLFKLNEHKEPYAVAGVPPDYFSATGQLWGNPVYDWARVRETGYEWWIRRVEHNLGLFDLVRIDHFRGLVGFWEVPAGECTAMGGHWVEAPAVDFLSKLFRRVPPGTLVAEDLGTITPDVREVMRLFDLPGMRLLLFAFGEDDPGHPYLPHNLPHRCLAYTGTHDNNTTLGWLEKDASPQDLERLYDYLGRRMGPRETVGEMVRLLMRSAAQRLVLPLQDILVLGGEARMNLPARCEDNWQWRMRGQHFADPGWESLARMTRIYGRWSQ